MTTELNALERETRDALLKAADFYKLSADWAGTEQLREAYRWEAAKLYALDQKWAARIVDNERKAGVYYKTTAEALEAHTARAVGMVEASLAKPHPRERVRLERQEQKVCSRCGKAHGDYAGGC